MSKLLFTGNANPNLAKAIAHELKVKLGDAEVGTFSDGETRIEIKTNVRGNDVFILQSTCRPTNDNLLELILMADALKRASASRITAVIPYFGYSRQDRRVRSTRVPISARVIADTLTKVGIDRVLTVDLHADQIQGFFEIPVDNVYATQTILQDINEQDYNNPTVVSPDVGGVVRARALAKLLGDADLAIIDKRRPEANVSEVMNIIGNVEGQDCIIVDDMIDTAGTLTKAAQALKDAGAARVYAYCVHPVLSGNAINNLKGSVLDCLIVTDTIPLSEEAASLDNVRVISLAPMLAECIRRINNEESLSVVFS